MNGLLVKFGELFANVLNVSITAAWIIPILLLMRLLLKKAPKKTSCLLWGILALRLIFPFSFESVMSLLPSAQTIPVENIYSTDASISGNRFYYQLDSGVEFIDSLASPIIMDTTPTALRSNFTIFAFVWLAGFLAMALYMLLSYRRVYGRVKEAVLWRDRIYYCDRVESPFIIGFFRPRIILPSSISETDRELVLEHEQAHLKRGDHLWKPLAFLLLSVHWFNPLMWLGYVVLCRDIELACDERVLREKGSAVKKSYANALINCSISSKAIRACPLAFGEDNVKRRISSVLSYKKPTLWLIAVSVVLCVIALFGFLTNPTAKIPDGMLNLIDSAISEHNAQNEGDFCALSFDIIGAEKSKGGTELTVYLWALYQEYSYDGEIRTESGSHLLTAITGKKSEGIYELVEYWIPKDGSHYKQSIKDKLPVRLWLKAFDGQRYIEKQQEECLSMAREYFSEKTGEDVSVTPPYYPYSFMDKQYKGESLIYDAGMFSSVFYTDDSIPQFFFKDMKLLTCFASEDKPVVWYSLGTLRELELTKESFDDYLTLSIWDEGYSAEKLRQENERAFIVEDEGSNSVHLVLEQKNSDIYIVKGYLNKGGILRWIFKMKEDKFAPSPEEGQIISAEKPYPYYMAITTDIYPETEGGEIDSMTDIISISPVDFISLFSADGYYRGFRIEEIQESYITVSFYSPMLLEGKQVDYCRIYHGEPVQLVSTDDERVHYTLYITHEDYQTQQTPSGTELSTQMTTETTTEPTMVYSPDCVDFFGTVLRTENGRIYLKVDESEQEYKSSPELYVSTRVTSGQTVPELKKGDRVYVVYDGLIQETYPPEIARPYSISLEVPLGGEMFHLELREILIRETDGDQVKNYTYELQGETIYSMGNNAFSITDEGDGYVELTFATVVFGSLEGFKPVIGQLKLRLNETETLYDTDGRKFELTYRITVADGYRVAEDSSDQTSQ